MLVRNKKTGKYLELLAGSRVPEGFEEVLGAGAEADGDGETEQKGEAPSRAGFGKNTAYRKSRGGKSGSSVVKGAKAPKAKGSGGGEKVVGKISKTDAADGGVYVWMETDESGKIVDKGESIDAEAEVEDKGETGKKSGAGERAENKVGADGKEKKNGRA